MKKLICAVLVLTLCMAVCTEALGEHFALRSRNVGPCRQLLGNVTILVVFVNTPQHPWTEKKKQEVYKISDSSVGFMRKNAKAYKANVNFSLGYLEFNVSSEASFEGTNDWYQEIIRNVYGETSIAQVYDRYRHDLGVDEAPMIFMFNSWDRSYTICGWSEEYCVIFCDTKMHNNYLTHELYHLYGAIDYYDYNNEGVAKVANRLFPKNVMACTGNNMDDLTAYILGWTDKLSKKANQFLQATDGMR